MFIHSKMKINLSSQKKKKKSPKIECKQEIIDPTGIDNINSEKKKKKPI